MPTLLARHPYSRDNERDTDDLAQLPSIGEQGRPYRPAQAAGGAPVPVPQMRDADGGQLPPREMGFFP